MTQNGNEGLVSDMAPNLTLMKYSGHFMFAYCKDESTKKIMKIYAWVKPIFLFRRII